MKGSVFSLCIYKNQYTDFEKGKACKAQEGEEYVKDCNAVCTWPRTVMGNWQACPCNFESI